MREQSIVVASVETCFLGFGMKHMNITLTEVHLTPVVHAQSNLSDFIAPGKILSHGYLLEGYLPVRVAFPSLAAVLLGQVDIPDKMIVSAHKGLSDYHCQKFFHQYSVQTHQFT